MAETSIWKRMFNPYAVGIYLLFIALWAVALLILIPVTKKQRKQEGRAREVAWYSAYDQGFTDGVNAMMKHAPIPKGSEIDLAPILKESRAAERYKEKKGKE